MQAYFPKYTIFCGVLWELKGGPTTGVLYY